MAKVFKKAMISEEITYIGIPPSTTEPRPLESENSLDNEPEPIVTPPFIGALPDGLEQERARLNEQINTLNTLLQSIPQAISDNRQLLSSDIADIVLLIASKFFISQQQNKNAITHQITGILTQLNQKQHIEITLHPHDLALIRQGELTIDLQNCKHITLKADDNLRLGGCMVTSEHGVFDASIERQIDNLKQVLLQMREGL